MEVFAVGPGQSQRMEEALEDIQAWVEKGKYKKIRSVGTVFSVTDIYLLSTRPRVIVELYGGRGPWYEVKLVGNNEQVLLQWRKQLRKVAGYRA